MKSRFFAGAVAAMVFLLWTPLVGMGADDDWEFLYTRDGIDVFRKAMPGTPAHAFKGFGFVDARLEVIGTVLRDIEAYPLWVARCKETVILKDIDFNTKIFYSVVDTPPPFKGRDMVLENDTVYHIEKGTAEVVFRLSDQQLVPPDDKYIRVPDISGEYLLEYFGRDKTRVTFTYQGCPGGNVPIRIADWIESKKYPYLNIMGIRRMVREQKYIDAGYQSPDREMIESARSDVNQVGEVLKNRLSDYIVDGRMIDIIFNSPIMRDMIQLVYEEKTSFESIQQAVANVFVAFASNPEIADLMKDKPLEQIVCIEKIMQEKWLLQLIAERRGQIEPFLDVSNKNIELIFYKILTSRKAVDSFIADGDLAATILASESIRTRLWQDTDFKKELLDKVGNFENVGDVESIIARRVGGRP